MNLVEVLRKHKVMGIVRGSSGEAAEAAALALFDAGVGLVEVSLTTPGSAWSRSLSPRRTPCA